MTIKKNLRLNRRDFDVHGFPSRERVATPFPSWRHVLPQAGIPQMHVLFPGDRRHVIGVDDFPYLVASSSPHEAAVQDPDGDRMLDRDVPAAPVLPRNPERGQAGRMTGIAPRHGDGPDAAELEPPDAAIPVVPERLRIGRGHPRWGPRPAKRSVRHEAPGLHASVGYKFRRASGIKQADITRGIRALVDRRIIPLPFRVVTPLVGGFP